MPVAVGVPVIGPLIPAMTMLVPVTFAMPVGMAGVGQLAVRVDEAGHRLHGTLHVPLILQHDVGCVGQHASVELVDAETVSVRAQSIVSEMLGLLRNGSCRSPRTTCTSCRAAASGSPVRLDRTISSSRSASG